MSGITGLDYSAVESVFRICDVQNRAEVFEGIQVMEVAVIKSLNKG